MKGHHVFKSESRPGDAFICAREPGNPHSPDAIVVKLGDSSGHVPDPLARILAPMLDGGVIMCMEGTVTGVARSAREGVWVLGGGIEIPCEYVLYGVKKDCEKLDKINAPKHTEVEEAKARRLKLPCVTVYFLVIRTCILC